MASFTIWPLYSRESGPGDQLTKRLGGPRVRLDSVRKNEIALLCHESNQDFLVVQPLFCDSTFVLLSTSQRVLHNDMPVGRCHYSAFHKTIIVPFNTAKVLL